MVLLLTQHCSVHVCELKVNGTYLALCMDTLLPFKALASLAVADQHAKPSMDDNY